jgi:hypothetical protein
VPLVRLVAEAAHQHQRAALQVEGGTAVTHARR